MVESFKKETKILAIISEIFVVAMLIIFPLITDETGYFRILEAKWNYYVLFVLTYIISFVLIILYFLIFKKTNIFKYKKINKIQIAALIFLGIMLLSCVFSPFTHVQDFIIGIGRREGIFTNALYILSFICLTYSFRFKKYQLLYFSVSSILLSLIAILQYIGFNPFHLFSNGIGTHNASFMTTIGNIDFVSAIYCLLIPTSFSAFIFLNNKNYEKIIHILSVMLGMFIIGIIDVQSGKVAFLATMIILFPLIVASNKRLSNFLIVIASVLFAYAFNVFINPEYHYDIGKLGLYIQFNYIVIILLIISVSLVILSKILKKYDYDFSNNKKIIKRFYIFIGCCILFGLLMIFVIPFKSGILYEMHELLHGNFDDNFGTYRIFLWKRTLNIIPEYPILGSGPDTFAIRFMSKYTSDIAAIGPLTINDTAANVYLTMIVNIGIFGLLSYLFFIFLNIKNALKSNNDCSKILLITFICFLIQDFFNLSLVIVTPVFWVLIAILYCSCIDNDNKKII